MIFNANFVFVYLQEIFYGINPFYLQKQGSNIGKGWDIQVKNYGRPFIIDVEASGFGQSSYPIEVGLALGHNEKYCSLIAPPADWTHWDKKAEAIHRITRNILIHHGKSIRKVAEELNAILGQAIVYSDGWTVDKPWISKLFSMAEIKRSFFISPLERILSEKQMKIWHKTKDSILRQSDLTRHRASTDAFIIQETYVQTLTDECF